MRAHTLAFPVELYHEIILFLDINDVLALRMATNLSRIRLTSSTDPIYQTCKYFLALTQERCIWSMMFTRMRATQALPCSRTEFMAMSSLQAERVLFAAYKVEASFLELRNRSAQHIPIIVKQPYSSMNPPTCSWRVLKFVSDRFLLSVDDIAVIIWDTSKLASSSSAIASPPWAHFTLSNIIGYADCYSTLYIAIAHVHVDHKRSVVSNV